MNLVVDSAGRGRGWQRLPSILVRSFVVPTHVQKSEDTSVTNHCHAATAQPTREYQSDHRRYVLTPATTCAVDRNARCTTPLDNTFHIRSPPGCIRCITTRIANNVLTATPGGALQGHNMPKPRTCMGMHRPS
jgi:hypothetical protein